MKKIVGILAAAAVLATSVFAADVSAKVRLDGDIFVYDGTAIDAKDGKVAGSFSMLRTSSQARPYWSPYITLSTSTDEAGAQILFIEEEDGKRNIQMDRSNVWFKPLDMLTVKVGFQGYNMHLESIDYDPNPTGAEDWGYAISYAQDAIAVNAFLITGNNGWFFKDAVAQYGISEDPASAYIKNFYLNGSYTADFGTITAMFSYEGKHFDVTEVEETEAETAEYVFGDDDDDENTPDTWYWKYTPAHDAYKEPGAFHEEKIRFGAGYGNTIDNLTFWADVMGTSYTAASDKEAELGGANFTDKEGKPRGAFGIMVDGFVQYNMDALTLKGYLRFDIDDFDAYDAAEDKKDITYRNNTKLGIKLRADYKLDNGINLFAQFNDKNLLQKENTDAAKPAWKDASSVFISTIKLGANGSVGICDWETKFVIDTGVNVTKSADADQNNKYNGVKLSMPIWFQVAF